MVELADPFYAMTHVGGATRDQVMHRLFVPMSNNAQSITHRLLFSM